MSWYLAIPLALAAYLVLRYFDRKNEQRQMARLEQAEQDRTGEENVTKRQLEFEKELSHGMEMRLPDAISGREVYVYRQLMREWFRKLVAQCRYDEPKLRKVRQDWLVYMATLSSRETHRFLALEGKHEKREGYERDAHEESMQLKAIEDAFAEAIGADAVERLRQIRAKKYDDFSYAGELAPDGYRYRGFSPRGEPERPAPWEPR